MEKKILPVDLNGVHIHFVGIKGTGMAALVEILHARGAIITGSDVAERFYTDDILEKFNIKALPFSSSNITDKVQYVIYSSAYSIEKNEDLAEAYKRKLPMLLYSEALGAVSSSVYSCSVCGVHGKTTTTGLVGSILKEINFPSQVLAGSVISSFGNSCTMTSDSYKSADKKFFVAETCEYQRHFMSFCPQKIILTSVESDHEDYYPTYESILNAFVDFICLLPANGTLIYCADDKGAIEAATIAKKRRSDIVLIPYGVSACNDYHLDFKNIQNGKHFFDVGGIKNCAVKVPGDHIVRNATAAIALCFELLKDNGLNPNDFCEDIKNALQKFSGGKRRSEIVCKCKTPLNQDVIFIDDYAHHPTAIKTTLKGYKDFYKDYKIIVDFMSHTYTRTAYLLEDFASSFENADEVILNKIYGSAREDASAANVTGKTLAERASLYHKHVTYAQEFDEAYQVALKMLSEQSGKDYPAGYIFVTMGAGDNWKIGQKLISYLLGK